MRSQVSAQSNFEYRPSGFHWSRRWPRRVLRYWTPLSKISLLFSLRSHVLSEAKVLSQKLTLLSDIAFAGVTERTMAIAPDIMETLLIELCRFLIEAADAVHKMAPMRTPEAAAYDLLCANAAVETLRNAIATRNREAARNPLRAVAERLGITLDETDPDWQRLALRVILDAEQENLRRDHGAFQRPSAALQAARPLVDVAVVASALPLISPVISTAATPRVSLSDTLRNGPSAPTVTGQVPVAPAPAAPLPQQHMAQEDARHPEPSARPKATQTSCPTIEEGSAAYIAARSRGLKSFKPTEQANDKAGQSWVRNSAPNVRSTARLFSRILGDKPFDQISDAELKAAWELVARLPHTHQAKTSKMSPQEAAGDADATKKHNADVTRSRLKGQGASPGRIESELLRGRIKRLRTATIYRHMQDFQHICVYMKKQGHLSDNIMADYIWESAEYERREILEEDNERLTWCGNLSGLFRTPIFQDKLEDAGNPMYWAPLIAVHMGLRSEEVLQLHVEDIQVIDDIPCIVLKQGPGQTLKSKA